MVGTRHSIFVILILSLRVYPIRMQGDQFNYQISTFEVMLLYFNTDMCSNSLYSWFKSYTLKNKIFNNSFSDPIKQNYLQKL
jgi:hypothetical protein